MDNLRKYIKAKKNYMQEKQFNKKMQAKQELQEALKDIQVKENMQGWAYKNYEVLGAYDILENDKKIATELQYLLKNGDIRAVWIDNEYQKIA